VNRKPLFARVPFGVSLLAVCLAASAARGQKADPVAEYSRPSTNVVVVLDLAQIDLDKLLEYATAKAKANGVAQADVDKGMAEIKPQLEQAKGGLAQFKQAGATKIYAMINATGVMAGDFGVVVIPTASAESAKKVSDMIQGMVDPNKAGDGPATVSVAGSTVVLGSKGALAEKPAANAALAKALAGPAAAALRIAVDGKVFAMVSDQAKPEDKAMIEGLTSLALSVNVPPASAFSMSVTAKDAASAKKVAGHFKGELDKGRNDPKAKEAMGADLTAKLYAAMTPKVEGSTVTLSLDTKTIEEVIVPAIAKGAAFEKAASKKAATPSPEK
jgi:hypothetical protein